MPSKISENASAPTLTAEEEHKLKRENKDLRDKLTSAIESKVLDSSYEEFISGAMKQLPNPPKWTMQGSSSKKRHTVIPVTNFSDWHLDEKVRSEEIQGKNAYDRQIAEARLKVYFNSVCKVARTYVHGFEYPGIVFNMLGDNFSGFIHEELRRTNAASMMESLLYWVEPVAAGLRMLADEFGNVWVNGVVGNHGRHDKKPVAKMRAQENFDWLFMHFLRISLNKQGEKRIQWNISEGHKIQFSIYDLRVIASHGDECKGGSGIAGMLSPQLIAYSRMKKTYQFDQWWIGHWHQLGAYRGIRVNGAGKGYDEYASINNFDFQPPMQDFFMVAPKAGVIASWPIFCEAENESWKKCKKTVFSIS